MKLASLRYRPGAAPAGQSAASHPEPDPAARDGSLVVVRRDLAVYADAHAISPTLQRALDDWALVAPRLAELSAALEAGRVAGTPLDPTRLASPLPRAYEW